MLTSFAPNQNWKQILNSLGYLLLPWRWFSWSNGKYPRKVAEKLKKLLAIKEGAVFTFDSGRTALYEVLKAFNIGENDEVLLQAFTCAVVPNSIIYSGAKPVYLDIEANIYNIDPSKIEGKITTNSKAIIIQHTFGLSANLRAILEIASRHKLIVIEDCAHSLGADYNGQKLGTFAHAGIFSFGVDKVISSVRGGAAYIKDNKVIQKLSDLKLPALPISVILKHLLHPPIFALGKILYPVVIGKILLYICKKLGFTARIIEDSEKKSIKPDWFPAQMPNALAHLAYDQLNGLQQLNLHRQKIAQFYEQNLPANFLKAAILPNSSSIYLRYPLQTENREETHQKAKNAGIFLGDWYDSVVAPKDTDLMAVQYEIGSCPVAEAVCKKAFNLPTHRAITLQKAQQIIDLLVRTSPEREQSGMDFQITKIGQSEQTSNQWENFLKKLDPNIFVQSWSYGDFFRALGEEAFVLGIKKDDKLIGGSLVVTTTAKRGRFLYLPYGPKLDFNDPEIWPAFVKELKKIAKEYKADFIRVSPFEDDTPELKAKFKKAGFRPAPLHVLAETTWILELAPDAETLFKAMRDTTRNLINRGKREGVEIKMTKSEDALKRLNALLQETASRHNFTPFSYKYMKSEFDAFQSQDAVEIFEAYFEGKLVSSAVIFFYGDTAVYRHGASTSERIKCQPSYLLQWTAIQEAKRRGMKYYKFWDNAPQNASKKHPFAGITTFKTGFGGFQKDLLPCQDLPLTMKYFLNWGVETFRRIKRGF